MALVFERIQTEGIAELSYLLGDDSEGVAAVFDPTPDVDKYLAIAREKKVAITHIFETHIHADLVSGARELCARVQSAKIHLSHEGDARYGFDHEKLGDGDSFTFGKTVVTARHTPGHTPEHVSFLVAEKDHPETPWGVLTGDSLFVSSAGRPDLLGSGETEKLTKQLFDTLRSFYLALPDSVAIFPGHGHGSPCGADIGDRLESTIGYERKFNPFLQFADFEPFKQHALSTAPPVPKYYPWMKKLNARGPEVLGHLPRVPGLPPKVFDEAVCKKQGVLVDNAGLPLAEVGQMTVHEIHDAGSRLQLVDVRAPTEWKKGHVPGARHIFVPELREKTAELDRAKPTVVYCDSGYRASIATSILKQEGFDCVCNVPGSWQAWQKAGLPIANGA